MLYFKYLILYGLIWCTSLIAFSSNMRGEDRRTLDYYNRGVNMMKSQGKYIDALSNLLIFVNYAEEHEEEYSMELMASYCYLGAIYGFYEDYTKAKEYFSKGYDMSIELKDEKFRQAFVNNLASCMIQLKMYDEAENMVKNMLPLSGKHPSVLFEYFLAKGSLAKARRDTAEARKVYSELNKIVGTGDLSDYQKASLMYEIADYFAQINRLDSQEHYLLKGYDLAIRQKFHKPIIDFSEALSRMYATTGHYEKAVEWQNKYFELSDSLMCPRDFTVARSDHEIKSNKINLTKIDTLNSIVRLQNILIIALIAIVTVALMSVIIYRQNKKIRIAYKALIGKEHKEKLERQFADNRLLDAESVETASDGNDEAGETESLALYKRITEAMTQTADYLNPAFGLAQLTSLVKSNTVYVSKTISHFTGDNVRAFINEYRINEAKRRLLDNGKYGNMTVAAIAESVGFGSQTSFNRSFRKVTGMTPSAYIKAMREMEERQNE